MVDYRTLGLRLNIRELSVELAGKKILTIRERQEAKIFREKENGKV